MMNIETPLNYTGSKFKLLGQILPEFDYTKPYFVDLFTGGGSVYCNVLGKYQRVFVNDIISDLVGIHQGIMQGDDIINLTKQICPRKDDSVAFGELREDYNNNPSPHKLWALMLSSTNNMMRFNKKFKYNQTFGKRSYNPNTDKKVEMYKSHIRGYVDNVRFTSKSFKDFEIKSNNVMVYCDPPYSNTEAGYNAYWSKNDDDILYNYLKNIDSVGSSFMISGTLKHGGNNCVLLDRLISDGYSCKELDFNYDKVSRSGKKETVEVIIKNY